MRLAALAVNAFLLLAAAAAVLAVQLRDRSAFDVERAVDTYAAAVQSQDLDAAIQEIAPDQRDRWSAWVNDQLGNVYDVKGVAVRTPDLLTRWLQHVPGEPTEATVSVDVNHGDPAYYQADTLVPVEYVDGRWYLGEPLLAHEAVDEAGS